MPRRGVRKFVSRKIVVISNQEIIISFSPSSPYSLHMIEPAQCICFFLLLKGIPESKGLVTGTGDNDLAVRAHSQIEHTIRVSSQADNLLHARILPHDNLVLAEAMRAHKLVAVL